MGSAVNWQYEIRDALANIDGLVLLNPRREQFDEATLDEQINWELSALEASHVIIMWFPRKSSAPIALFETGLYMRSGKLLVGAETGFYRRRNLEITTQRYGTQLLTSLAELAYEVIREFMHYKTA